MNALRTFCQKFLLVYHRMGLLRVACKTFIVAILCCFSFLVHANIDNDAAAKVNQIDAALTTWDVESAKRILEQLPDGPIKYFRAGMLAVLTADYADAEQHFVRALAFPQFSLQPENLQELQYYLELTRGAQQVFAKSLRVQSPDGKIEVVFANEKDQLLAPYLFAAVEQGTGLLEKVFAVHPDAPVRFEILDDPAQLALLTPLTLDHVYTTGTVGVTKYRRILLISPRVMVYGYPWLDTALHEYVHYVVTLRTANRAPVWLQEGLAKLFEQTWRTGQATELDGISQKLLEQALREQKLITLEEMYPSIAMLPSQEQAALAYAEVQSMLGHLYEQKTTQGLDRILTAVADGMDAKQAFALAWGQPFEQFFMQWQTTEQKRLAQTSSKNPQPQVKKRQFKQKEQGDEVNEQAQLLGETFPQLPPGKAQHHARLGVLLTLRGHLDAAAQQYEKSRNADPRAQKDAKLARYLGELYLRLDRPQKAMPLLIFAGTEDPEQASLAAAEGRARLRSGDREGARRALARAIQVNPFIPTIHCDLAELAATPEEQQRETEICKQGI